MYYLNETIASHQEAYADSYLRYVSTPLDFIRTMERTYRPEDNALLLSIENGMATAYLQDL